MILLSRIDEMEVSCKCAYYVDCSMEVTAIDDMSNFFVKELYLFVEYCRLGCRCMGDIFSAFAQAFTITPQLFYDIEDGMAVMPLHRLPQCIAQRTATVPKLRVLLVASRGFGHWSSVV